MRALRLWAQGLHPVLGTLAPSKDADLIPNPDPGRTCTQRLSGLRVLICKMRRARAHAGPGVSFKGAMTALRAVPEAGPALQTCLDYCGPWPVKPPPGLILPGPNEPPRALHPGDLCSELREPLLTGQLRSVADHALQNQEPLQPRQ